MRYKIRDLPAMLRSSQGRRSLLLGQLSHFFPAFRFLAGLYRRCLLRGSCVVVVIGSLGKTTTARMAAGITGDFRHSSKGNAYFALIHNLLRYRPKDPHVILEVGIEKPGQMLHQARMIRPDIAIVTSIASEHILSFKTLEGIREEKAEMVRSLPNEGTAILNADDPHVMWMATQTRASIVTYGISNQADIKADNIKNNFPGGTSFEVTVRGQVHKCQTRLLGTHMVYPALAAIALAEARGLDIPAACEELFRIAPVESRMQSVRLDSGAIIIRDEFKSTRESVWSALETLEEFPARRKILVLGGVSEVSNQERYSYFRDLGTRIGRAADFAYLHLQRNQFRRCRSGAVESRMNAENIFRIKSDPISIRPLLPDDLGPGDVILVKGRSENRFSRLSLLLMGKQVECRLEKCRFTLAVDCQGCELLGQRYQSHPLLGPNRSLKGS